METLSTPVANKIYPMSNILCGTYFLVQREKLGEAVKRLREAQNWSLEDVRKNCHGKLATSYLWRIENGEVSPDVISVGKIGALATGLRVPAMQLFEIAREVNNNGSSLEGELLGYFRDLTVRRQQDLVRIATMYYQEQSELAGREGLKIPEGVHVKYIKNTGSVTDGELASEEQRKRRKG